MIEGLNDLSSSKGYDSAMLAVTNIKTHYSKLVVVGDVKISNALPFDKLSDHVLDAAGGLAVRSKLFLQFVRLFKTLGQ